MTRATAFLLLILAAWRAAAVPPETTAALVAVPRPNLGAVEDGVRRQLERGHAELEELLTQADGDDARLADAFGALGRLYHAYDLAEPAEACYDNAHHLAPGDFRWIYLRGFLQRINGQLEDARASLEAALALRPADLPARLHLAFVELSDLRFERAETLARQALETDAECAAAFYVLGRAAQGRQDFSRAVEHFDRVLALQPAASRVHYLLAQLHRRLGNSAAARHHLENLGTADVGFPDPLVKQLRQSPNGAAAHMQHGARARAGGLPAEAAAAYRKAVALDPGNVTARRDLGLVLSESGDLEGAIEQYRQALELEPDNALTLFSLGLLLKDRGDASEAVTHLEKAVELEPEHRDFRFVLATQLAEARDFTAAADQYREILERDSDDSEALLHLAMSQAGQGDLSAAGVSARGVLDLDAPPWSRARAHHVLATVRLRGGAPDEAESHLRRAIEHQPSFSEAHFMLANLLGQSGRLAAAADHFRRVLEVEPERLTARLGEATALALAGREREAVERLEEGMEALPAEPVLAHTLARLLVSAADPGVRDGERALVLASQLFQARHGLEFGETLAMALAEVGRFADAVKLQRSLIAEAPADADPRLLERLRHDLDLYEKSAGN